MIIYKFGGVSVKDAASIKNISKIIDRRHYPFIYIYTSNMREKSAKKWIAFWY